MAETSMTQNVSAPEVGADQGVGGRRTLAIAGVDVALLNRLEEIGEARAPKVRRNDLIIWVLSEFSVGRLIEANAVGAATSDRAAA